MKIFRPEHPLRVGVVAVIALLAVNAAIFGARAQRSGPPAAQRPHDIQQLYPQEGELQVPQAAVGADLRGDYAGQVTIDGHVIPKDQLTGDPSLGQIIFVPGPDRDFREIPRGAHVAVIEWWPREYRDAGAARAAGQFGSYSWSFKVG